MDSRTMVWLRLDWSFIFVVAICFLAPPLANSCRNCSRLDIGVQDEFESKF
jgi:hypothetical protein